MLRAVRRREDGWGEAGCVVVQHAGADQPPKRCLFLHPTAGTSPCSLGKMCFLGGVTRPHRGRLSRRLAFQSFRQEVIDGGSLCRATMSRRPACKNEPCDLSEEEGGDDCHAKFLADRYDGSVGSPFETTRGDLEGGWPMPPYRAE